MLKLFAKLIILFYSTISFGQISKNPLPRYLTNPTIPPFNILKTDSTEFTKNSLPKGKSVVLIYFSPDCVYCQNKARQIKENIDSFNNTFFLWVSCEPWETIKQFATKYGLDKFENMKVGRDERYFIPSYYKVKGTPYIVVYKSNGLFKKEFRDGARWQELVEAVK